MTLGQGKQYPRNKEFYYIYILARSSMNFYKHVGFTIGRKQRRLENYIKRVTRRPELLPHLFPTNILQTHL